MYLSLSYNTRETHSIFLLSSSFIMVFRGRKSTEYSEAYKDAVLLRAHYQAKAPKVTTLFGDESRKRSTSRMNVADANGDQSNQRWMASRNTIRHRLIQKVPYPGHDKGPKIFASLRDQEYDDLGAPSKAVETNAKITPIRESMRNDCPQERDPSSRTSSDPSQTLMTRFQHLCC
jgi:hypothetical protein